MKKIEPYKTLPRLNPACKYVSWIVETSKTSSTNPMPKQRAMRILVERRSKGQYAELIKVYTCVQSKKLI